ncbi:ligand-binding sensor domain-containing diguanylate cyclase [Pseudomarimonas arenosa]|uniref:diguanylate cyclase n=1 Tax=Pseudomarimonas arenosa TaxID=2774145 RepID=A0AAW3ZJB2_9GAMM|nr:ligand-binding sensor domain-containing diguanylate cyclase [Pseudomarimonas arenosa]MBD8525309.1 diguanylate cyclase [Pseudomarimonas arenosa]
MNGRKRWAKPAGLLPCLLALMLFGSVAVHAATADQRPLSHYLREVWTTREGLPHNLVNGIAQTEEGYLWFATWEGAVSYNGRDFRLFGRDELPEMPDEGYRAVIAARDGGVWLGSSRGGIARVQRGQWEFLSTKQGLSHNEVMALLEASDGSLWIGYQFGGVDRRHPDGRVEHFAVAQGLPSPLVNALHEDADGRIWIATGTGLAVFDHNEISQVGAERGLPAGAVFAVHSQDDRLLVGGEFGLVVSNGGSFASFNPSLDGIAIQRILRDRHGTVWAGATHRGLYRLRADGGVDYFGEALGLPNQRVASLFEDREHSLWVGTSGGLMRLREGPFVNVRQAQGLADDYVRSVLPASNGELWIGSSTGLVRMRGNQAEQVGPLMSVLTLAELDGGELLIGTYLQGVMRWANGMVQPFLDSAGGLPSNQVRTLLSDAQDRIWIGTTRGLLLLDGAEQTVFDARHGLPREYVLTLHQDRDGRIWAGTDKGLAWFNEDTRRFEHVALIDGAESVFGIAEDADGAFWLASDRGVIYRRGDGLARIGYAHGLPVEKLFQIVLDQQGHIWISSNRGVIRLERASAKALVDGRVERLDAQHFTELDGMASAQCNGGSSPSAALLHDGRLAFSTALGLSLVDPAALDAFQPVPPPVAIERVMVDDRRVRTGERASIVVPPGSRRIEFSFAGLSFLRPETITYRYRLDGFDRNWVESSNRMSAEFTSLPPGRYQFRVSAALRRGLPYGSEASVQVQVLPFWWQRPITWFAAAAVGVLLVLLLVRYRHQQQKSARQVLERLVDERTEALREQTERLVVADRDRESLLTQLREQSEAFERQAREDPLTGLANRRAFDEWLRREFARFQRLHQPLCLAVLDLDHFKRINDCFSHSAGDQALQALAQVLQEKCRTMDLAARFGGEEFALILPNSDIEEAHQLAERLRSEIAAIDCGEFAAGETLTASFGVASAEGCTDEAMLVRRADQALYEAKRSGRDRVCVWQSELPKS